MGRKKRIINIWDSFGKLKVVWESESKTSKSWRTVEYSRCLCRCGNYKTVRKYNLLYWHSRTCWCSHVERRMEASKRNKTLWMEWTTLYRKFMGMKSRCNKEGNIGYKYYWWRWIMCLWDNFESFYNDMSESYNEHCIKYWENNTTIERIDVNWNYCKENCTWATKEEQRLNTRRNKFLTYNGETLTLCQRESKLNIKKGRIGKRLGYWWSIEDAIETPKYKRRKKRSSNPLPIMI